MIRHFNVEKHQNWLQVRQLSNLPCYCYAIYINGLLHATYYYGNVFYLQLPKTALPNQITVYGYYLHHGIPNVIAEQYVVQTSRRNRDFKPGDILVASDNLNEIITGYVGHSALVVDENNVIESPGGHPAIVKDTIQQFLDKHPEHAQFRPKSAEMGMAAVNYAENYLKEYKKNLAEGKEKPEFSYKLTQSLKDPWEYIYCSKLIWLSYLEGADYEIENDYLWISPEDLYTQLKDSEEFETIYENENVDFKINT